MIVFTNFDNGKKILLNRSDIVFIEDLGSCRLITFRLTSTSTTKIYVSEPIDEIFTIMPR